MLPETIMLIIILFTFGIVIGSFLNVYIFRNQTDEKWYSGRSHCMSCGYTLAWFDLIPVFSYIFLGGKCRKCHAHISLQYPIVELITGIGFSLIGLTNGYTPRTIIYCLAFSAMIALSGVDLRTFEIPDTLNIFIGICGIVNLIFDYENWPLYVIGFFAVSTFLYLIFLATKGKGIGGGDVKLMAACGLLIGWKNVIIALFLGCIIGSTIHLSRMKISGEQKMLAFGPYLSVGVFITMVAGGYILNWYIGMF